MAKLKDFTFCCREKSPGQAECEEAIDVINQAISEIDRASMAVLTRTLTPETASSLDDYQEQMLHHLDEIESVIEPLNTSAKSEAETLGHRITDFATIFPKLASMAIRTASRTKVEQQQSTLLEQTKTVAESASQVAFACKSSGGNPKVTPSTPSHTYVHSRIA